MPKRSSKAKSKKAPRGGGSDPNQIAARILRQTTGEGAPDPKAKADEGKNPAAVELGRLGGKKGGAARAAKLTAEQRREIAKKAAQARWQRP